ncbi:MAG: homoserine kinase [Ferrimicrobium sp.]
MVTSVRIPASSANLGPGFDVLGLALARYMQVSVRQAPEFSLVSRGLGSQVIVDRSHLGYQVAMAALGHDRVAIEVDSDIPLARGLGSSGALALGVAAACGHPDPLTLALSFEGHPENVAASFYGGAVAAGVMAGSVEVRRLRVDPELVVVAVIPDREIPTEAARRVLPLEVPRVDAVFNLSRAVLLAESLGDRSLLRPELFSDRLHQAARSRLFPEAAAVIEALLGAGALGACWSGAGSSCVGFTSRSEAHALAAAMVVAIGEMGLVAEVEVIPIDQKGLVVLR